MISLLRVFVVLMVLMVAELFFFFFGVVVRREEDALCFNVRVVIARLHVSLLLLLRFLSLFLFFSLSQSLKNPKCIKIPYPLILWVKITNP